MRTSKSSRTYSLLKSKLENLWRLPVSLMIALAIVALFAGVVIPAKESQAAPYALCETRGILFQYPGGNTHEHLIDMVTGDDTEPPQSPMTGRSINAIGYNVQDHFVYGWDNAAGSEQLVRIHENLDVDELGTPTFAGSGTPYTGPTTGIIIGDVDENGDYWFIGGPNWYQVDLTPGSPTEGQITDSGSAAGIAGTAGADWAYVPGGEGLYRVMDNAGTAELWVFDRSSQSWSLKGPLTSISGADLTMGAFYADSQGFLYGSSNSTGNMWRIDIDAVTATLFSTGPSSSSNDGARCAEALIPIDFGDAPSTYNTLLSEDGPRHAVEGYSESNHTAPLMLGEKVDIESDGFPGAEANGDDTNNIDDEEGVTHIVATPGTPTALSIPTTVTNSSSQEATLAGWIDLNNNGTFEAGERVTTNIPANSGTKTYELNFPEVTFTADSHARFRLFEGTVSDPQPTGSATGGEVEDVLVQVGSYEVTKTSTPPSGSTVTPGDTITYTLDINNTGLTDLIDLTLHDDLSDVLDDASLEGTPVVSPASAGTASVDNDQLEFVFTGDVLSGQSVSITYSVKVNNADALGNGNLRNLVIAAHSNCHPDVIDAAVTVSHPDCSTEHPVNVPAAESLANTGNSLIAPLITAGGLISTSVVLYLRRKLTHQRP